MNDPLSLFERPIDKKRMQSLHERTETPMESSDIWYLHTTLCQCFLPYQDPKTDEWQRTNGDFSIALVAGHLRDPESDQPLRRVGLPYGPKPRLFQSYICMKAIKHQSPVVPVERSMSDMMHMLGLAVTGGRYGTIRMFKEQIIRFAACHFTIVGPGPKGSYRHVKTTPVRRFDVFFPTDPRQGTLWPSEIQLTADYYESLKDHAVPFDFRALKPIQAKPRSQDIYVWLTQRLCRLDPTKPLLLRWKDLCDMFGGELAVKDFKKVFPNDLRAAQISYPGAKIESHEEGFIFRASQPPVPKVMALVK
jgi:hypothetical protein